MVETLSRWKHLHEEIHLDGPHYSLGQMNKTSKVEISEWTFEVICSWSNLACSLWFSTFFGAQIRNRGLDLCYMLMQIKVWLFVVESSHFISTLEMYGLTNSIFTSVPALSQYFRSKRTHLGFILWLLKKYGFMNNYH